MRAGLLFVLLCSCAEPRTATVRQPISVTRTTALSVDASPRDRLEHGATFVASLRGRIPAGQLARTSCLAVFPGITPRTAAIGFVHARGFVSCKNGSAWSAPQPVILTGDAAGVQTPAGAIDLVMLFSDRQALARHLASGTDPGTHTTYALGDGVLVLASCGEAALEVDADTTRTLYGKDDIDCVLRGGTPAPAYAHAFMDGLAGL